MQFAQHDPSSCSEIGLTCPSSFPVMIVLTFPFRVFLPLFAELTKTWEFRIIDIEQ
jgi:hypothetical protein